MALAFTDNFEENNFDAWNQVIVTAPDTITTPTDLPYKGTRSLKVEIPNSGNGHVCLQFEQNAINNRDLYFSFAHNFPSGNNSVNGWWSIFAIQNENFGRAINLVIDGSGQLIAEYENNSEAVQSFGVINDVHDGQWRVIEGYVHLDDTNGIFNLWSDGQQILNLTNIGIRSGIPFRLFSLGAFFSNGANNTFMYLDEFQFSTFDLKRSDIKKMGTMALTDIKAVNNVHNF